MDDFSNGILSASAKIKESLSRSRKVYFNGVDDSFKELSTIHVCQQLNKYKNFIFVLPNSKATLTWHQNLQINLSSLEHINVGIFPYFSQWSKDRFLNHRPLIKQRMEVLSQITSDQKSFVITNLQALSKLTLDKNLFTKNTIELSVETPCDQDDFIHSLHKAGYQETSEAHEPGYFTIRGGIIDFFSVNHTHPIRVEFLGDTIASIRLFSSSNQRSFKNLTHFKIYPCQELLLYQNKKEFTQKLHEYLIACNCPSIEREGMTSHLREGVRFQLIDLYSPLFQNQSFPLEYLDPKNSLFIYPNGQDHCIDSLKTERSQIQFNYQQDIEHGYTSVDPANHFQDANALELIINNDFDCIEFQNTKTSINSPSITLKSEKITITSEDNSKSKTMKDWLPTFSEVINKSGKIVLVAESTDAKDEIENCLRTLEYSFSEEQSLGKYLTYFTGQNKKDFLLLTGKLVNYFWDYESQVLFIPQQNLISRTGNKKSKVSHHLKNFLTSFKDLKFDDLVIHSLHGLGRYKGLRQMTIGGQKGDFIDLEYLKGDKIYVPVDRISQLQRYFSGSSEKSPNLDRLGGQSWLQKKSKVKSAVKVIAQDLLNTQAKRILKKSHIYTSNADEIFQKFLDDFPYKETHDQAKAWSEIEHDLCSPKGMDRVLVGDVGFGKTEVALRATMRAVLEGFQVMVLVPTTVLCYQHELTFKNRLERHGVSVCGLNRFVATKLQKQIIYEFNNGQCDVIIGTHRILSKDCIPKNLGLIIIDEEHRFGVIHKEKLKEIKANTDILSLTATPIPRTLHMALIGLKDISILASPPSDRLAVKTFVSKFDDLLIKDAINFELNRGGQIFFVYNRVVGIEQKVKYLKSLIPNGRISFAHGQMQQQKLEKIIVDFLEHKFDILVTTTIIESGIDMPNVNTILVDQAERFGLAQLYQLRGRVGRSSNQAYAYFLTNETFQTNQESLKRLEILQNYQELGAGFHIANYDLEFRGAGNLIGGEQSGYVNTIGFEMYTKMLDETIKEIKGEEFEEISDPEIKIQSNAHIPSDFIEIEGERLQYYRKIFACESIHEIDDTASLIKDRYGAPPKELLELYDVAKIKIYLKIIKTKTLLEKNPSLWLISFEKLSENQLDFLMKVSQKHPEIFSLNPDFTMNIQLPESQTSKLKCLFKQLETIVNSNIQLL